MKDHIRSNLEEVEYKFNDFLNLIIQSYSSPWKRWWINEGISKQYFGMHEWSPEIKKQLRRITIPKRKVEDLILQKWILDVEHGFFHGLMAAFIMFWYKFPQKHPEYHFDKEDIYCIPTCIFHDFARFAYKDQNNHDAKLKDVFPHLNEVVYTHCNPEEIHPMIVGDRTELRRYPDHENWCEKHIFEYFDEKEETKVKFFYRYLRTALELVHKYRNDVWLRHGFECLNESDVFEEDTPYPRRWVSKEEKFWNVEIGTLPLRDRLVLAGGKHRPRGLLPIKILKEIDENSFLTPWKSHFKVYGKIPLRNWIFLIEDDLTENEIRKNMGILGLKKENIAKRIKQMKKEMKRMEIDNGDLSQIKDKIRKSKREKKGTRKIERKLNRQILQWDIFSKSKGFVSRRILNKFIEITGELITQIRALNEFAND